jgi:hypothetical protein
MTLPVVCSACCSPPVWPGPAGQLLRDVAGAA